MANVLITGASGFLGRYIYDHLHTAGHAITTLSRHPANFPDHIQHDFGSGQLTLPPKPIDWVVHAAGKAHVVPKTKQEADDFYRVNQQGTQALLQALGQLPQRPSAFILISTVAVYGRGTGVDLDESTALQATDPYGKSKLAAEEIVQQFCQDKKMTCAILRLPLIAGKQPPGNLGNMIKGMQTGRYMGIGKGDAKRSIVLARDVAAIIPKVATTGGTYNLTDGYDPTFYEIQIMLAKALSLQQPRQLPYWLAKMAALAGSSVEFITRKKMPISNYVLEKMTSSLTFSCQKAKKEIGWAPAVVIEHPEAIVEATN